MSNGAGMDETPEQDLDEARAKARRAFLMKCGRFAAVTGPAVALMLSLSSRAEAGACPSAGCG
jgi:hypothetical protein